jgi:hypothetical protein
MAQSFKSSACIHWGALPVQIAGADTNTVGDRDAAGDSGRMVAAVGVCHTAVSLRAQAAQRHALGGGATASHPTVPIPAAWQRATAL